MTVHKIVAAILTTLVLGIIAALCLWTQQPWIAPSLGSAAFLQTMSPEQPSAKPYSIALGQVIGGAAGFLGVFLVGAAAVPSFTPGHELTGVRVAAIAIAVVVSVGVQLASKASSPAGGATALVVALGAESPNLSGAGHLLAGIALVTVLGEGARQIMLRLPGSTR